MRYADWLKIKGHQNVNVTTYWKLLDLVLSLSQRSVITVSAFNWIACYHEFNMENTVISIQFVCAVYLDLRPINMFCYLVPITVE